jgi:hypothetical protein
MMYHFLLSTMRGWSRSCNWIMAYFLLRATSSRVVAAKTFLSIDKVVAFSVLPDTLLRSSSSKRTLNSPVISTFTTPSVVPVRSFSSANYPSGATTKRSPRLYSRKNVSGERLYRADRVLANRSGKSRSECFDLLQEKRVWQVDPTITTTRTDDDDPTDTSSSSSGGGGGQRKVLVMGPSVKMSMHTPLWIDQTEPVALPPQLLQVYHKPVWVLSVRSDPVGRPCLNADELLPNMHPVGRLE